MALPWLTKVSYSTGSVCARKPAANANRTNTTSRRRSISEHLEHDQRQVVVLGCSRGEPVGARNHGGDDILRGKVGAQLGSRDQAFFSPFLKAGVHGFTDSVGEGDEGVVRPQLDSALLIVNFSKNAKHRSAGVQALYRALHLRV